MSTSSPPPKPAQNLNAQRAGCTICSPNYLSFARVVAASYIAQHPDHRFFVLIVADLHDPAPFLVDSSFTPVMLTELPLHDLRAEAMKYDILELNTNVKPTLMLHLLEQYNLDALTYLDPDIFVYAPLDPVYGPLSEGATAVITPHMTTPVLDGKEPSEQQVLYNGVFNLGFIAVSATDEAKRLLRWWEERCLKLGFSEGRSGLFVDQKWINLAPGLFDRVVISRDPGLNMAYWNLHERALKPAGDGYTVLSEVNGPAPLRFYHFSGVVPGDVKLLSKHTERHTLEGRPDLQTLFADYKTEVLANKLPEAEALPYGWDRLSDGTTVTRLARRLFAVHIEHFKSPDGRVLDPFDAKGAFTTFAKRHRLVKGALPAAKSTWKEFNPNDRRVQAVHRLLKFALRVLGPHRYELLMRYLGHITILRNQGALIRDKRWKAE